MSLIWKRGQQEKPFIGMSSKLYTHFRRTPTKRQRVPAVFALWPCSWGVLFEVTNNNDGMNSPWSAGNKTTDSGAKSDGKDPNGTVEGTNYRGVEMSPGAGEISGESGPGCVSR